MNAYDIVTRLGGRFSVATGKGTARCPAHDDRSPSLSVAEKDGVVLVHCHSGCEQDDVIDALREKGLWDAAPERREFTAPAQLQPKSNGTAALASEPLTRIVGQYDYTDEQGNLLFQALRFEPKAFKQRQPDGHGGWQYTLAGVRRVLYRLPELIGANPTRMVFIVEGEKDVDRLMSLGLLATCNPMGAGKWLPEYNAALSGRHVCVLPDNDKPGRDHADAVVANLLPGTASLRRLALPGLLEHGDVSDWLDAGGSRPTLEELVLALPPLPRPASPFMTLAELVDEEEAVLSEVVPGLVWSGRSHWIYSGPGAGKTLFRIAVGMHVAAGIPFCGRPVKQGPVLLLEEDSPKGVIADYVRLLADIYHFDLASLPFYVNRLQGYRATDPEAASAIETLILSLPQRPIWTIFDACERIVPSDRFNSKELDAFDRLLRKLTESGMATDTIDHTRKPQSGEVKVDPMELLYGGRSKSAISDVMLFMSGEVKDGAMCTFTKFRGEKPPAVLVKFDPDEGFSLKQQRRVFNVSEQAVMKTVNNAFGNEVTRAAVIAESGKSADTIDRAVKRLERDLLILVRRDRETYYRTNPGSSGVFE